MPIKKVIFSSIWLFAVLLPFSFCQNFLALGKNNYWTDLLGHTCSDTPLSVTWPEDWNGPYLQGALSLYPLSIYLPLDPLSYYLRDRLNNRPSKLLGFELSFCQERKLWVQCNAVQSSHDRN